MKKFLHVSIKKILDDRWSLDFILISFISIGYFLYLQQISAIGVVTFQDFW